MEWSDVRIFLAVARGGTLGAAARALGLSHPTIGRRLRALEEATGQILFQRTSDGFVLTEEGGAILGIAEQMEDSALAMTRRLAGQEQQLTGALTLSCADWFGAHVLPPILSAYGQSHPRVTIDILTGGRLFNLARREADLAFRIVPFDGPDIIQRRLLQMPYGAYIAQDRPDPVVGDGAGCTLIVMDTSTGHFPDADWLKTRLPKAEATLRSNSRGVQAQMCAAGIGVAVLPRPVGDGVGGLRRLDLGEAPPPRDIWMGYHRDLKRLQRLRAFIDVVADLIAMR